MSNSDFWEHIKAIISGGFTPEGLAELDEYADKFTCGQLLYKRFSPSEQYGCSTGGHAHVIASLLAGAEAGSDTIVEGENDFKRQCQPREQREQRVSSLTLCRVANEEDGCQRGEAQACIIEQWARTTGCWTDNIEDTLTSLMGEQIAEGGEAHVYDHGATLIKSIGLDYYIEPILALDRISLHNAYFPETRLSVLGFGRDNEGAFRIIAEQQFIEGTRMTDEEIADFMKLMGFKLINPRNWTYSTPDIYLSDMHDENVIQSYNGAVFVVDCDIRINTPELRCGGMRALTTEVEFRMQ